jgi:hypothetical protein
LFLLVIACIFLWWLVFCFGLFATACYRFGHGVDLPKRRLEKDLDSLSRGGWEVEGSADGLPLDEYGGGAAGEAFGEASE